MTAFPSESVITFDGIPTASILHNICASFVYALSAPTQSSYNSEKSLFLRRWPGNLIPDSNLGSPCLAVSPSPSVAAAIDFS